MGCKEFNLKTEFHRDTGWTFLQRWFLLSKGRSSTALFASVLQKGWSCILQGSSWSLLWQQLGTFRSSSICLRKLCIWRERIPLKPGDHFRQKSHGKCQNHQSIPRSCNYKPRAFMVTAQVAIFQCFRTSISILFPRLGWKPSCSNHRTISKFS